MSLAASYSLWPRVEQRKWILAKKSKKTETKTESPKKQIDWKNHQKKQKNTKKNKQTIKTCIFRVFFFVLFFFFFLFFLWFWFSSLFFLFDLVLFFLFCYFFVKPAIPPYSTHDSPWPSPRHGFTASQEGTHGLRRDVARPLHFAGPRCGRWARPRCHHRWPSVTGAPTMNKALLTNPGLTLNMLEYMLLYNI